MSGRRRVTVGRLGPPQTQEGLRRTLRAAEWDVANAGVAGHRPTKRFDGAERTSPVTALKAPVRVRPSGDVSPRAIAYTQAMSGRKWSDLSAGTRTLLIVGAAVEGCLKAAALTDIARRPRTRIRGSKWLWAAIVTVVNSFGGAPLAYFAFGRR